jgi:hypothetical protein
MGIAYIQGMPRGELASLLNPFNRTLQPTWMTQA